MRIFACFSLLGLWGGCAFDGSTRALEASGTEDRATCDGFVPKECGDCGLQFCAPAATGAVITCQGDPNTNACGSEAVCSSDGRCNEAPQPEEPQPDEPVPPEPDDPKPDDPDKSPPECEAGETRPCGECAVERCNEGEWSETCEPSSAECADDEQCLAAEGEADEFRCTAVCSTRGHRTPVDDEEPIGDWVVAGTEWFSTDGCRFGDYRICECERRSSGDVRVRCDRSCMQE